MPGAWCLGRWRNWKPIVGCRKGHRISSAIAVEVPNGVGESACPVGSKAAFDRGAIIYVIKTGGAKCVVTRYSGRAVRGSVGFFHGSRADRSRPSRGIELD